MLLPTQYLNPVVLRCSRFNGYPLNRTTRYAPRTVYDYELEYYIRSDGGIRIDGRYVPFRAGELNIRKPGQMVEGVPPYECYILCVDMLGNGKRSGDYSFGTPEEAQERYENPLLARLPDRLSLRKKDLIASLLENILQSYGISGDLAGFRLKSSLYFLFSEIFQEIADSSVIGGTACINRAIRRIREEFSEPLNVNALIAESGLSRGFFHQRFQAETGMTPGQLIAALRIEKAKNLLCFTQTSIGEIGALCGYPDSTYFARIFRRHTGITPTAYRSRTTADKERGGLL